MTPRVRYQYHRFCCRFRAFTAPDGLDPTARVLAFLATLAPSQRRMARTALRHQDPGSVRWTEVRVARPKRDRARLHATILQPEEYERFWQTLRLPRDRALIGALAVLRRCEVAVLRWDAVNLDAGLVYVEHGKSDVSAPTLLPPRALAAMREWYHAAGHPSPDAVVFPGRLSRRQVSPPMVGRWVDTLLRRAGMKRTWRNAHAFRRGFSSAYLRANPADLSGLKELLRHESLSSTVEYVFLQPDDLRPRLAKVRL